jgi:hypothetical protein
VSSDASAAHLYGANAVYNNSLVGASPYRVMVKPGAANASRSFVAADASLEVAGAAGVAAAAGMARGVPVKLVVRAVDAYGCPLRAGGDVVAATLKARVDIAATVVDKADGTYEVSFTPTQPGPALLQVTINGHAVGGATRAERGDNGDDSLPLCPSVALATPAATGAPYAVYVADRGAALVGAAVLSGADSPAPAGANFALAAWFKPIAAPAGGLNRSAVINVVARGVLVGSTPAGFSLALSGDVATFTASLAVGVGAAATVRSVTAQLPTGLNVFATTTDNVTTTVEGTWTHVAAVYSGGNKWVAYVDGVLVKTETFAGVAVDATAVPSAAATTVGDMVGLYKLTPVQVERS